MKLPLLSVSGLEFGMQNSTTVGWVICGLLGLLSISSWAVMVSKWLLLSRASRANRQFLAQVRDTAHPLALFLTREHVELSPLYHIYHHACRELAFYLTGELEPGRTFTSRLQGAGRISPSQMNAVQEAMERSVSEAALRLEGRMGVVATALTVAPFLGLLGTVWGVLDCFSALSDSESAGLATMAPGMSAALLTTVVGLLVAIPSMMGYNVLVNRIRSMIVRLENYSSDLSSTLDRNFVDHRLVEDLPSMGEFGSPAMPTFTGAAHQSKPTNLTIAATDS